MQALALWLGLFASTLRTLAAVFMGPRVRSAATYVFANRSVGEIVPPWMSSMYVLGYVGCWLFAAAGLFTMNLWIPVAILAFSLIGNAFSSIPVRLDHAVELQANSL